MRVARGPVGAESETDTVVAGSIVVDDTQRRRSRFRTRTSAGEEVGVVVDGAPVLAAGDYLETDDGERFVVELEAVEALVVDVGAEAEPATMLVAGHAVGNRHWDLASHDGRVYVPSGGDPEGRIAFVRSFLPPDADVSVESVEPTLFDEPTEGRGSERHTHDSHRDESDSETGGHVHGYGSGAHEHTHEPHEHGSDAHGHEHTHATTQMTRDRLRKRTREESDDE